MSLFSLRKWSHIVNNDPTERLFKNGYGPEWSSRMFWFGFHITRLMSQDQQFSVASRLIYGPYKWVIIPLEDLLTPKCSFIDESWATLTTAFLYTSCGRSLYIGMIICVPTKKKKWHEQRHEMILLKGE
jgi:hypothetical protein